MAPNYILDKRSVGAVRVQHRNIHTHHLLSVLLHIAKQGYWACRVALDKLGLVYIGQAGAGAGDGGPLDQQDTGHGCSAVDTTESGYGSHTPGQTYPDTNRHISRVERALATASGDSVMPEDSWWWKRYLNIGCGTEYAARPWTNVDKYPGVEADVIADACCLPIDSTSVRAVYAGHLFEHLKWPEEVFTCVAEAHRVLMSGGLFLVVGPDYHKAVMAGDRELVDSIVHGGCRWPGDEHQWICAEDSLLVAVRQSFPDAAVVGIDKITSRWPLASRHFAQSAVIAAKE